VSSSLLDKNSPWFLEPSNASIRVLKRKQDSIKHMLEVGGPTFVVTFADSIDNIFQCILIPIELERVPNMM
jgi:hypothetical protein